MPPERLKLGFGLAFQMLTWSFLTKAFGWSAHITRALHPSYVEKNMRSYVPWAESNQEGIHNRDTTRPG